MQSVVADGTRLANGMPKFGALTDGKVDALLQYIRQQVCASRAMAKH